MVKIHQNLHYLVMNGEELKKEIVAINEAIFLKEPTYELKYNVEVDKKSIGLN